MSRHEDFAKSLSRPYFPVKPTWIRRGTNLRNVACSSITCLE